MGNDVTALDIPFVSEAYDRLIATQRNAVVQVEGRPEPFTTGDQIRALRAQMSMTQAAFAELLGIDAPSLSKLENGGTIKPMLDYALRYLAMTA